MKQKIPQYGFGGFLKDAFMTGIVKGIPVIGNLADNYTPETKLGKTIDKVMTPINSIKNQIGYGLLNSVTGGIGGSALSMLDDATSQKKPDASNEQIAPVYEDGGNIPQEPQYINIEKGELRINPQNYEIIEHYNDRRFSSHSKDATKENPNNFVEANAGDFIIPTKYSKKYINFPELRSSIVRQVQNNNLDKRDTYVKTPDAQFVKCGGSVKRHGDGDLVGPFNYDYIPPTLNPGLIGPEQQYNFVNPIQPKSKVAMADYQMPTNPSLDLQGLPDYSVQTKLPGRFSVPRFSKQMDFKGKLDFPINTESILERSRPKQNFFGKTKEDLANERMFAEKGAEQRAKAYLDPTVERLSKELEQSGIERKTVLDNLFSEGQGKIDAANKLARDDKRAYYGQLAGDAAYLYYSDKTPFENLDLQGTEAIDYLKGQSDPKLSASRAAVDNAFNKVMETIGGMNQNQRAARINSVIPNMLAQTGQINQQEALAAAQQKGNIASLMSQRESNNTQIKNANKERKEQYLGAKNTRRAEVAQKSVQYPLVKVKQTKQEMVDAKKMEEQIKFLKFLTKAYPAASGDLTSIFQQ